MRTIACIFVTLLGCGESGSRPDAPLGVDAGPIECGTSGSAVVTGSVDGETIDPITRVIQSSANGAFPGILIDEAGVGCSGGMLDDFFLIATCKNALAPGVFQLGGGLGDCPTMDSPAAGSFVENVNGMGASFSALSGNLMIDSIDAGCAKGSFSADFVNGQHLEGVFAAIACP